MKVKPVNKEQDYSSGMMKSWWRGRKAVYRRKMLVGGGINIGREGGGGGWKETRGEGDEEGGRRWG